MPTRRYPYVSNLPQIARMRPTISASSTGGAGRVVEARAWQTHHAASSGDGHPAGPATTDDARFWAALRSSAPLLGNSISSAWPPTRRSTVPNSPTMNRPELLGSHPDCRATGDGDALPVPSRGKPPVAIAELRTFGPRRCPCPFTEVTPRSQWLSLFVAPLGHQLAPPAGQGLRTWHGLGARHVLAKAHTGRRKKAVEGALPPDGCRRTLQRAFSSRSTAGRRRSSSAYPWRSQSCSHRLDPNTLPQRSSGRSSLRPDRW